MIGEYKDYERFRDAFAGLLDKRFYDINWLDQQVSASRATLICTDSSAVLVEIRQYPTGAKEIHGLAATGEMGEIVHILIPEAEQFGRENGCIVASIASREGWSRKLPDYELHQVEIRKDL